MTSFSVLKIDDQSSNINGLNAYTLLAVAEGLYTKEDAQDWISEQTDKAQKFTIIEVFTAGK